MVECLMISAMIIKEMFMNFSLSFMRKRNALIMYTFVKEKRHIKCKISIKLDILIAHSSNIYGYVPELYFRCGFDTPWEQS